MHHTVILDECALDTAQAFLRAGWTLIGVRQSSTDEDFEARAREYGVLLVTRDQGFEKRWIGQPFRLLILTGNSKGAHKRQLRVLVPAARVVARSEATMARVTGGALRFGPRFKFYLPNGLPPIVLPSRTSL